MGTRNSAANKLNAKQALFVREYLSHRDGAKAYANAYGKKSPDVLRAASSRLLSQANVAAAVLRGVEIKNTRLEISTDRLLTEAYNIVTADPRELIELHLGCCRYCFGENHKWQRTVGEFNHDFVGWTDKDKPPEAFDAQGGIGFDARKLPNPDCPKCAGAGHANIIPKDTRYLSKAALSLYAGVHHGKDGLRILMHDKGVALEKLMRHSGLYEKDNKQKTTPLGEAMKAFVARIHAEGSGRAPVVPQQLKVVGGSKA